jgi:uncharacterized membrane protein YagU involved in acid resistance
MKVGTLQGLIDRLLGKLVNTLSDIGFEIGKVRVSVYHVYFAVCVTMVACAVSKISLSSALWISVPLGLVCLLLYALGRGRGWE